MPFEVWKTYRGSHRHVSTLQAFREIYKSGGIGAFWKGWQPKMVEAALKGGILMYAKEAIVRYSQMVGLGDVTAGLLGGFGGGVAQVIVLGPCTFLVTAAVVGNKNVSMTQRFVDTFKTHGISGFYRGGVALMLRQGSSWASRQGFTEYFRGLMRKHHDNPKTAKLSVGEEMVAGFFGGALSTWNQPFEVLRIEAQSAATKGHASKNIYHTYRHIVQESGHLGLFQGIVPRIGIAVVQTFYLVTVPILLKPYGLI